MTYSKWVNIQELLGHPVGKRKTCCLAQVLLPRHFQTIVFFGFFPSHVLLGLQQMVSEVRQNDHIALVTLYGPPGLVPT